jgi:hypothetical protein
MIVPRYWAEARVQERRERKSFTVRRYGWSDSSQEDAQARADERARDALQRIMAGEELPRRERKTSYGVEGVPIREEVVEWHGDSVVTRNAYGARCLNTPKAFFIDVDFNDAVSGRVGCTILLLGFLAPLAAAFWLLPMRRFLMFAIPLAIGGFFLAAVLLAFFNSLWTGLRGGQERIARRRIERYFATRDLWRWRLYRTPFGYRVLVIHRPFDPNEPEVDETFTALRADPLYAVMCKKQGCFRARVSPKPWRVGVERIRPRFGAWPIPPELTPERQAWIERYERAAADFAACRFEGEFGEGIPDSSVVAIQRLHDRLCRAESGSPLA